MTIERLRRVLGAEGLPLDDEPELIASESNEVWRVGARVIRICWRGDRGRLQREAAVAAVLPTEVGYPEVLTVGRDAELSWMITRLRSGVEVQSVFGDLHAEARHRVGRRLGELLRIVHETPVPAGIDDRGGEDIVGEDILPLPVPRTRRLLQEVTERQLLDQRLADTVAGALDALEHLDPFATPGALVHGDAGITNLLWDKDDVVALIDFEWARSGASWVDLLGHIRYGDRDVARGVREAYPDPFGLPDAGLRLQLLEIATALRTLALYPGPRNLERLRRVTTAYPPHHDA